MPTPRLLAISVFFLWSAIPSRAGDPAFIAGSGYLPGVEGQPIRWASGSVQYFTDQGNLSPILSNIQADSFVAAAFSAWTSVPGVALTATQGGHLAEDVNGSNIAATVGGVVTAPADIISSATATPVAIVYDFDGSVTDAILGQGAGGIAECFTNAVYGGPDSFSSAGNIVHAVAVINGNCAATTAQLPDVQYRLVRVLGRILGLGWSQANVNVLTRTPVPSAADYAGFPVMHNTDPISCVPIGVCYANAAVPKMDDAVALAKLYPATVSPQPAGRIYGRVYFTDASGNATQPMQGVNVLARLIDPITNQPSRQSVATSVSGFAFHGNAGNIVLGYLDASGLRYDRWGSNDVSLEGFFDLGQLPVPIGQTIALYQLSVEALNANWSTYVGPYAPAQVTPSGSFNPVVVTIQDGSNIERDIFMSGSELVLPHPGSGATYVAPASLPLGGSWGSWISGYGSTDWFEFSARGNRTASISVTAIDEAGNATESKLSPLVGVWQLADLTGNPAPTATPFPFNTGTAGMSRLDVQFGAPDTYRIGVADFRGDGRPDYFYQANLLYSDTMTPSRLGLAGGIVNLNGVGFNPRQQVAVGTSSGVTLSASSLRLAASLPGATLDGPATVQVTDPASGAFSKMIGALTYGAADTDLLQMLQGSEPLALAGGPAAFPIRVRAVASDGVTPVGGASVAWNATNGLTFAVCNGLNTCTTLTDQTGESSTMVTPTVAGVSTITAALAPASYLTPQTQQASVVATSSALDLVAFVPTRWIAKGATLSTPLAVKTLNLGVPIANVPIIFSITQGTVSLSAATATTDSSGSATVMAAVTNQSSTISISACVAPNNAPCQIFTFFSTPPSLWNLETVNGSSQVALSGQTFQPLVMRVTDGSAVDNPVMGATVTFTTTLAQISQETGGQGTKSSSGQNGMPVILGTSQTQVMTSLNGLAYIVPSAAGVGPCDVFVSVSAGAATDQFEFRNLATIVPVAPAGSSPTPATPPKRSAYASVPGSHPLTENETLFFATPQFFPMPQADFSMDPLHENPKDSENDNQPAADNVLFSPVAIVADVPIEKRGPKFNQASPPLLRAKKAADKNDRESKLESRKFTVDRAAISAAFEANVIHSAKRDKRSCRSLADDLALP